jgi:hypothetical protein
MMVLDSDTRITRISTKRMARVADDPGAVLARSGPVDIHAAVTVFPRNLCPGGSRNQELSHSKEDRHVESAVLGFFG